MRLIWVLTTATLLLTACSGPEADVELAGDDETAKVIEQSQMPNSSSTDVAAGVPSEETLLKYFEAITADSIPSMEEALDLSIPGSLAHAYAIYQVGLQQAMVDAGSLASDAKSTVRKTARGYEMCDTQYSETMCYDITDVTGKDGKVANFSINDRPLESRIVVGDGESVPFDGAGAEATLIAAFEASAGDHLFVVLSVNSGSKALGLFDASFRSTEGRQTQAAGWDGPSELLPDSLANYAFVFPNAKVGGTITVSAYDYVDYNEIKVELKTR